MVKSLKKHSEHQKERLSEQESLSKKNFRQQEKHSISSIFNKIISYFMYRIFILSVQTNSHSPHTFPFSPFSLLTHIENFILRKSTTQTNKNHIY